MGRQYLSWLNKIKGKCRLIVAYAVKNQWFDLLHLIDRYLPNALLITGENYVLKFTKEQVGTYRKLKKLRLAKGKKEDIDDILMCEGKEQKRKFYERLLEDKRNLYIAYYNEQIAGFCWSFDKRYIITHDSYRRSNIEMILEPNACVLGNGFINRRYRLIGIFPHMISNIIKEKMNNGEDVYALVNHTNIHSLKSHYRLGFNIHCTIRFIRIGFLNILRFKKDKTRQKYEVFIGNRFATDYLTV